MIEFKIGDRVQSKDCPGYKGVIVGIDTGYNYDLFHIHWNRYEEDHIVFADCYLKDDEIERETE